MKDSLRENPKQKINRTQVELKRELSNKPIDQILKINRTQVELKPKHAN